MSDKPRLMVVDNEIDICNFIKMFFEMRGFEVATALNGDEAMAKIHACNPEVVLLDIRMRWEMEGLEYLSQIKEQSPGAKVILVTGIEDEHTMERAKKLGADSFMIKPLMLEHLENIVLEHVNRPEFHGI
jgi:DNA-binding NtrC family response regulator